MDTALIATALASAAFAGSHLGLSSAPVRSRLVAGLGEKGFQGLYALLDLLLLGALIATYSQASHHV